MSSSYVSQRHINEHYDVVGFISSGTYGRVYKARAKLPRGVQQAVGKDGRPEAFAIKK